jgi:hypothetical protein
MVPPDLGEYTVEDKVICALGTDDYRRKDVTPVMWKTVNGTPVVSHVQAMDNTVGLASRDHRMMETVATEHGHIALGRGAVTNDTWMPTVADLRGAPYTDTRFTAISDRYYR